MCDNATVICPFSSGLMRPHTWVGAVLDRTLLQQHPGKLLTALRHLAPLFEDPLGFTDLDNVTFLRQQ